ncbi:hypothetical protein [Corynebacterium tuberculostearicum]|uniref:hypothetical protein n=1 Tax=Corynebacterium tuberculostearicum TaxID=38304 RepID=UPI0015CE9879|nr:hypothetical protein [Corynebacterium tuberculostearicum]NYI55890.1 Zn-dependent peptidase ImmA (M78 family) [Corynebacterium tuberculostearicum]QQU82150.1 hypothetical protein I6I74_01755 [Corynebacterium tuberculostearicum]
MLAHNLGHATHRAPTGSGPCDQRYERRADQYPARLLINLTTLKPPPYGTTATSPSQINSKLHNTF